jgi:hypothetical protein
MESKLLQTEDIGLGTRLPSRDSLSVSLSVQARTQNHC